MARLTKAELESIALGEKYQFPKRKRKRKASKPRAKKRVPKKRKPKTRRPQKKAPPKKVAKPPKKGKRSFKRKIYRALPESDNQNIRQVAKQLGETRDALAEAKAEIARLKRTPEERRAHLETAKHISYRPNREKETERLLREIYAINAKMIDAAVGDDSERLQRIAELQEQLSQLRRAKYEINRPIYSQSLLDFRNDHQNGERTFIDAALHAGLTEREAYTLWHSPR